MVYVQNTRSEENTMWMLIWKNIARRRNQSALTVTITMLAIFIFVMVLGVFQTVNR